MKIAQIYFQQEVLYINKPHDTIYTLVQAPSNQIFFFILQTYFDMI